MSSVKSVSDVIVVHGCVFPECSYVTVISLLYVADGNVISCLSVLQFGSISDIKKRLEIIVKSESNKSLYDKCLYLVPKCYGYDLFLYGIFI